MDGYIELGTITASLNCTNPCAFQMALFLLGHTNQNGSWTGAQIIILYLACCPPSIYLSQLQFSLSQLHESHCRTSQSLLRLMLAYTEKMPATFLKVPGKCLTSTLLRFLFPLYFSWRPKQYLNRQSLNPYCLFRVISVNRLWLRDPSCLPLDG